MDFGGETLAPLPVLRSLGFKSISSFLQGRLCRSGTLRKSQLPGQAGGGQSECGAVKCGGDFADEKQKFSREE